MYVYNTVLSKAKAPRSRCVSTRICICICMMYVCMYVRTSTTNHQPPTTNHQLIGLPRDLHVFSHLTSSGWMDGWMEGCPGGGGRIIANRGIGYRECFQHTTNVIPFVRLCTYIRMRDIRNKPKAREVVFMCIVCTLLYVPT